MADLISPKSLAGKYFINAIHLSQGAAVLHGKILGPVSTELAPYFLCEIYPTDDESIAVTAQTILTLDNLVGVYLYDERAIFEAEWQEVSRRIAATKRRDAAERRAREKMLKQVASRNSDVLTALAGHGVKIVDLDGLAEAMEELEGRARTMPPPAEPE